MSWDNWKIKGASTCKTYSTICERQDAQKGQTLLPYSAITEQLLSWQHFREWRKPSSFLRGAFRSRGEAQHTQSEVSGATYSRKHPNEGAAGKEEEFKGRVGYVFIGRSGGTSWSHQDLSRALRLSVGLKQGEIQAGSECGWSQALECKHISCLGNTWPGSPIGIMAGNQVGSSLGKPWMSGWVAQAYPKQLFLAVEQSRHSEKTRRFTGGEAGR